MDSLVGEDPTLPIDFDGSLRTFKHQPRNFTESAVMNYSNEDEWPDGPPTITKARTGQKSPVMRMTVKDVEAQLGSLKKENFSLKLRIFHMEEQMRRDWKDADNEGIVNQDLETPVKTKKQLEKENIELKVSVEQLRQELSDNQQLLIKARKALDDLESQREMVSDMEETIHRLRAEMQLREVECQELRQALELANFEVEETKTNLDILHELRQQQDIQISRLKEQNERLRVVRGKTPQQSLRNAMQEQRTEHQRRIQDEVAEQLKGKDEVIHQLYGDVEEKDNQCKKLQEEVTTIRNELHKHKLQAQKKEKGVNDMVLDKEGEINRLNSDVEEREHRCKKLENKVQSLKKDLQKQKMESQKMESQKKSQDDVSEQLRGKDNTIKKMTNDLDDRVRRCKALTVQVESLKQRLTDQKYALQEHYTGLLEDHQDQVKKRDRMIIELSQSLGEKDQLIKELMEKEGSSDQDKDSSKEVMIQSLRRALKDRDQSLEEAIDEKFKSLELKDDEIRAMRITMREKDRTMDDQGDKIDHLKDRLAQMEDKLQDREAEIGQYLQSLKTTQKVVEETMANHERVVAEKEGIIKSMQEQMHNKDEKICRSTMNMIKTAKTCGIMNGEEGFLINDLNDRLKERDSLIEEVMAERSKATAAHEKATGDLMQALKDKDQYLKTVHEDNQRLVTEKDKIIRDLEKSVNEKDRELQGVEDILTRAGREQKMVMNKMKAVINDRDKTIEKLIERGREKDRLFREIQNGPLTAPKPVVRHDDFELKEKIAMLETEVEEKQAEIERLTSSEPGSDDMMDRVRDELDGKSDELSRAERLIRDLQTANEKANSDLDQLRKQSLELQNEMKEKEKLVDSLIKAGSVKESLIKELEQKVDYTRQGNASPSISSQSQEVQNALQKQLREIESLKTACHAEKVLYENMRRNSPTYGSVEESAEKESLLCELATAEMLRGTLEESVKESIALREQLEQQLTQSPVSSGISSNGTDFPSNYAYLREIDTLKAELQDTRDSNRQLERQLAEAARKTDAVSATNGNVVPMKAMEQWSRRGMADPMLEDETDDGRSIPGQEDEAEVARMDSLAKLKQRNTELEVALKEAQNQSRSLQRQLDLALENPDGSTKEDGNVVAILKEQLDQAKTLMHEKDQEIEDLKMKFMEKDYKLSSYEDLLRENEEVKEEVRCLAQEKADYELQLEDLSYQISESEEQSGTLREEIKKLQNELKDMYNSRKQKHKALDDSYKIIKSKDEEIRELSNEMEDLKITNEAENNDFREELQSLSDHARKLEEQINQLHHENDEISAYKDKVERELEKVTRESDRLKSDWDDFNAENSALNTEVANLNLANEELQADLERLKEENGNVRSSGSQSNKDYGELSAEIANLNTANEQLQADLDQLKKDNKKLTTNLLDIDQENYELSEKNNDLAAKNQQLDKKCQELTTAAATLNREKSKLQSDLENSAKENNKLRRDQRKAAEENSNLECEISEVKDAKEALQSELDKAIAENGKLKSDYVAFRKENRELQAELDKANKRQNKLQLDKDNLRQEKEDLQKDATVAESKVAKLSDELSLAKAKAAQDNAEKKEIIAKKERLEREIKALKSQAESAKRQLSATEGPGPDQDRDLLAKINDMEKQHADLKAELKYVKSKLRNAEASNELLSKQMKLTTDGKESMSFNPQLIVDMANEVERLNTELKKSQEECRAAKKQDGDAQVPKRLSQSQERLREVNSSLKDQIELLRSQLEQANKSSSDINKKLQGTEATVRQLSYKVKMYRNRMKSAGIIPPGSPTIGRSISENCLYGHDEDLDLKWPSSPVFRNGEDLGFRTPSPKSSHSGADMFPEYGDSSDPTELKDQIEDLKCQLEKSRQMNFLLQRKISSLMAGRAGSPTHSRASPTDSEQDAWFEYYANHEVIDKLQSEVQHLNNQLDHYKNLHDSLLQEESIQRSDLKKIEDHKQSMKESVSFLDGQRQSLQRLIKELGNELKCLAADKSVLTADNKELEEQNRALKRKGDALKAKKASSTDDGSPISNRKMQELNAKVENLRQQLVKATAEKEALEEQKSELEEKAKHLQSLNEDQWQRAAFDKTEHLQDLNREVEALRQQLSESREICEMLQNHLEQLVQTMSAMVQQNHDGEWKLTTKVTPRKLGIMKNKLERSKKLFSDLDDTLSESRSNTYLAQISQTDMRQPTRGQKTSQWRGITTGATQTGYESDESSLYSEGNKRGRFAAGRLQSKSSQTSISSSASVRFADTHTLAEYNHLKRKLEESTALNESLKAELEVYKKVAFDRDSSFDGAPDANLALAEHLEEIRILRKRLEETIDTNDKLREQLEAKLAAASEAEGDTAIIYLQQTNTELSQENSDLKDMLIGKDMLLTDKEKTLKDAEKTLDRLRQELMVSKKEQRRLKEETQRWQEQLEEKADLNKSLKVELSFFEKLAKKADAKSRRSPSFKDGAGLDLNELLAELRHLRIQLEKSIDTNNALRVQLEHLTKDQLSPASKVTIITGTTERDSRRLSPKQLFDDKYDAGNGTMKGASSMPSLYTGRGSPKASPQQNGRQSPPQRRKRDGQYGRLSPTAANYPEDPDIYSVLGVAPFRTDSETSVSSSRSGAGVVRAIGHVSDYNTLKEHLQEMHVLLGGVESRIRDRRRLALKGSSELPMLREMAHSVHSLRKFLDEMAARLSFFRIDKVPSIEEYVNQKRIIASQETVLQEALERLKITNKMKEGLELGLINQLSETHRILSKAKTNLEGRSRVPRF